MATRRRFLQQSTVVALSPCLPAFLSRSVRAENIQREGRVLVVIQLDGGNDGLNTVIPFADDLYARHRSELFIPTRDVVKLNDQIGLHRSLQPAADLFHDGRLTIVQGVGYPNPNRSHFESMSIWQHARLDTRQHDNLGWLGRAADLVREERESSSPDSISVGVEAIPIALRGRRANAVAVADAEELQLLDPMAANAASPNVADDLQAFVSRTVHQSYDAARQLEQVASSSSGTYPANALGQKLQLASRLIKLDGQTRVYYVAQPGYDTHAGQLGLHSQLLREFASALDAFLSDLRDSRLDDRVVVLVFSEFGRRVQENGSAGTDHGAAGPVFLAGTPVAGDVVGAHPSLSELDNGDLRMSIDFRQVYATLLDSWLGIVPDKVLDQHFAPLQLISA